MKSSFAAPLIAAVLLFVLASTVIAQNASTSRFVVTVVDQTGAVFPGALVRIIDLSNAPNDDWLQYAVHALELASVYTDASGQAAVGLAKGSYAVAITAPGFKRYVEKLEIREEPTQALRVTLLISGTDGFGSPCVTADPVNIPLEQASPNIFIPLELLQTIALSDVSARRRWFRF
jgi:hypothetical protein